MLIAGLTERERKDRARNASIARRKKENPDYQAPLPVADRFRGIANLGDTEIECYVLSNGDRVMSMRQCVKAISGTDSGDLKSYLTVAENTGSESFKSLIIRRNSAAEIVEFQIKGNPQTAKGLRAETFADICSAYVEAAYKCLMV